MLPLLAHLAKISSADRGVFEDWHCIYVQHILRSNLDCVEFLRDFGMAAARLHIFGKSYSTNKDALNKLRRQNIDVVTGDGFYNFEEPFDDHIVREISRVLRRLCDHGAKHVLLIDEGGIATRAFASTSKLQFARVAVVELTARGAQQYRLLSRQVPIVDVARSATKKLVESKIIAKSMFLSLESTLRAAHLPPLDTLKKGLIGVGAIGQALIGEFHAHGMDILYCDADEGRPRNCSMHDLSNAQLLLSATGEGSDWLSFVEGSKDTLFANCGSSDVEFNLWSIRPQLEKMPNSAFDITVLGEPWRGLVAVRSEKKKGVFLRGGFPVNFDGSEDPIPSGKISITRAILMAGAIQAVKTSSAGVVDLDALVQHSLRDEYMMLNPHTPF